jgi:ribosomal protein S18 acetylase RimI-like enzyme
VTDFVLRSAVALDLPFLREMLYEAAHAPGRERLPMEVWAETYPEALTYFLADWPRVTDLGVVAESQGASVGAAWCRLFTDDVHAWGYVDAAIPELAIAVVAERRGEGIGRAMLTELITVASRAGFSGMSLNVDEINEPARHLYESTGFRTVRDSFGLVMLRER